VTTWLLSSAAGAAISQQPTSTDILPIESSPSPGRTGRFVAPPPSRPENLPGAFYRASRVHPVRWGELRAERHGLHSAFQDFLRAGLVRRSIPALLANCREFSGLSPASGIVGESLAKWFHSEVALSKLW
jgi:hypothetical protein